MRVSSWCNFIPTDIVESAPEHADAPEWPFFSQFNAREYKKVYSWSRKSRWNGAKMVRMFWPTGKVFLSMSMHLLKCPWLWWPPMSVSSMLQEFARPIDSTRGFWRLITCDVPSGQEEAVLLFQFQMVSCYYVGTQLFSVEKINFIGGFCKLTQFSEI